MRGLPDSTVLSTDGVGLVDRAQLLLRVGYPAGPASAPTGRRPVMEVGVARGDGRAPLTIPARSVSAGRLP